MSFHVNILLGVDAAYNHNAFVVSIMRFLVCDKIVDHRFPIARPQLGPQRRPGFLELPEDSAALSVGEGLAEGSIPCNVCEQESGVGCFSRRDGFRYPEQGQSHFLQDG